jgi:phage shock protein PspC (stress-responsive transcriptional regulator)
MSVLEVIMLLCFGAAWPFSLYRSWRSRSTAGKSPVFLAIVLVGYLAGIAHKLLYSPDTVTLLYALNAGMVAADIALYARNRATERRLGPRTC